MDKNPLKRSKQGDEGEDDQPNQPQPTPGTSGATATATEETNKLLLIPNTMPAWAEHIVKRDITREQQTEGLQSEQRAMREQQAVLQSDVAQVKELLMTMVQNQSLPQQTQTINDVTMQTVASQQPRPHPQTQPQVQLPTAFNSTSSTEVRNRVLNIHVPPYPAEGLSFDTWLLKFKMCADLENWSVREAHAKVILTCGGQITDEIKDLNISSMNLNQYYQFLLGKFGRKPMTANEKFKMIAESQTQKEGEGFRDFAIRIKKCLQLCRPDKFLNPPEQVEADMMQIFRTGLVLQYYKDKLNDYDLVKPLETLDQCVSVCESVAKPATSSFNIQEIQKPEASVDALDRKVIICRFCKKKGHVEKTCWKKHGRPEKEDKPRRNRNRRNNTRNNRSATRTKNQGRRNIQELSESLAKAIFDVNDKNNTVTDDSDSSDGEKDF